MPVPEEKERLESLFNWIVDNGSNFDKLKIRYYAPDYRGVHAARNLRRGDTILYVPRSLMIVTDMVLKSTFVAPLVE